MPVLALACKLECLSATCCAFPTGGFPAWQILISSLVTFLQLNTAQRKCKSAMFGQALQGTKLSKGLQRNQKERRQPQLVS